LKLFLRELLEDLNLLDGIGLYITHDAIIIPIIKYFTEKFEYSDNLIDYLDGFIFWKNGDKQFLVWNKKKNQINDKIENELGELI